MSFSVDEMPKEERELHFSEKFDQVEINQTGTRLKIGTKIGVIVGGVLQRSNVYKRGRITIKIYTR